MTLGSENQNQMVANEPTCKKRFEGGLYELRRIGRVSQPDSQARFHSFGFSPR
jgi:hypothetical protein